MAASALPETLKSITAIKFQELTKQRDLFETIKAEIYAEAESAQDPVAAALALLNGVKKLKNVHLLDDETSDDDEEYSSTTTIASDLHNKSHLLRQASVDPSVPPTLVSDIHASLKQGLEFESVRRQYSQFFSALVTEWLANPDKEETSSQGSNFETVGRKEMHEQRATWESLVFKNSDVDPQAVDAYLQELFKAETSAQLAHEQIVKSTKNFSAELWDRKELFTPDSLKDTMDGVVRSDLLSEEKNATIKTFLSNTEVLKEVADVLNMRFASLSTWNWTLTGKAIPVEMRRQLNGKYRVFMDEDVLDAILLYEIGLLWSIHFKATFTSFFNSFAWKRQEKSIPQKDLQRREYYLGASWITQSIQELRRTQYANEYFLTQLPSNRQVGKRNYDDDNAGEEDLPNAKGALDLKHSLLHILVTESLISNKLHPDETFTVLRSDFKWFGPSLPHNTIFTVLKFFGVSDVWIGFFKKYLRTPISFSQDGPDAAVQVRERGIPLSHSISDMLGETVLFVMDYAVNQATSSYLYRLHDDFWIWGPEETCLNGWQAMTKFATTLGLEFNQEKTGTVRFGKSSSGSQSEDMDVDSSAYSSDPSSLPVGDVRWGFLRLDALSRRFLVDQSMVDTHIKELQTQLSCCNSVFSYIQAYNAYAGRFFTNNFGKPSFAFGREHVDMMISTFRRIQQALFPNGSVTDHLAGLVAQRFGIKDLPQGVWYLSVDQGGFDLNNPLIALLGMRSTLRVPPTKMIQRAGEKQDSEYYNSKAKFQDNGGPISLVNLSADVIREIETSEESFMSKEEYLRHVEDTSSAYAELYSKFLETPDTQEMQITPAIAAIMAQGDGDLPMRDREFLQKFSKMTPYWKWMISLYGKDIVKKYGSVRIIDAGQIPLGVVNLLKRGRVRWRG